jgi:hypothetical protein
MGLFSRTAGRPRRVAAVLLASAASLAGLVGTAAPAHADAWATVGNTGGVGLTVRAAPTPASAAVGLVSTGTGVSINCQAYGASVTNEAGFTSTLWDYVPARGGYLADAYLSTGYDARIPGVPLCAGGTTPPSGSYVPIRQNQGQYTEWEDCGPTSVVTALLRIGVTPHEYAYGNRAAIERARVDMGLARGVRTEGTSEENVRTALRTYGLTTVTSWDFDASLAHVRAGRPAIMAGNTRGLSWATQVKDPVAGVAHFVTVAGYDSATGRYRVLDPIAVDNVVHLATRATLLAYWDNYLGRAAVLV